MVSAVSGMSLKLVRAIERLATWLELIKFEHSVFALPFALMATFMAAGGWPGGGKLALIVACMVLARTAAMTYNRIADAKLDAANPRTAGRAIPSGRISVRAAWALLAVSAAGFMATCGLFYVFYDNAWPVILGGPLLAYLCVYSVTKRFTIFSHFWLGSALGLSPVGAWIAIDPATLGWAAAVLCLAVTCWTAGFDILYACQDVDFDRRTGLYSVAAKLGIAKALWVARVGHAGTVGCLMLLGRFAALGWLYFAAVGVVAGLLIIEHALVRPTDLSKVNVAFFTVNGCVSILLALATIVDILL